MILLQNDTKEQKGLYHWRSNLWVIDLDACDNVYGKNQTFKIFWALYVRKNQSCLWKFCLYSLYVATPHNTHHEVETLHSWNISVNLMLSGLSLNHFSTCQLTRLKIQWELWKNKLQEVWRYKEECDKARKRVK